MAIRNFWVDVKIDGRTTDFGGGPRAKDGGMSVDILQRDGLSKMTAVKIRCWVEGDELITNVSVGNKTVANIRTNRKDIICELSKK